MVSFFKDRSAVSIFWLIIVCFGLHVYSLINTPEITASLSDGFFYYVLKPFTNADPYFISLIYVFLIFLISLQVSFLMNDLRMQQKQSYTSALAFVLFSSLLPVFNAVNAALLACNFVIWILYSACRLYAAPNAKSSIYNLGLLTGTTLLLYFPSLFLVLIVIAALGIIRPFKINEWFVLFFGIITPVYLLAGYLFLTDNLGLLPKPDKIFQLIRLPAQKPLVIVTLIVAAATVGWGILSIQNSSKNVLIQVRKSWSVFLVAIILLVPSIFFVSGAWPGMLLLIMIPAACYLGFAFVNSKNILPAVFFWLLVALSIYNNWFAKY